MDRLLINLNVIDETIPLKFMSELMQRLINLSYMWESVHFFAAMTEEQMAPIMPMCHGTKFFVHRKDPKIYDDNKTKRDTSVEIAVAAIEMADNLDIDMVWFCGIDDNYIHLCKYLLRIGTKIGLVFYDEESEIVCREILPHTSSITRIYTEDYENVSVASRLEPVTG